MSELQHSVEVGEGEGMGLKREAEGVVRPLWGHSSVSSEDVIRSASPRNTGSREGGNSVRLDQQKEMSWKVILVITR